MYAVQVVYQIPIVTITLNGFAFKITAYVNVNVNVKNIYRRCRMSRVRIGGAGGRINVRLSRMQQQTVLFSDVP